MSVELSHKQTELALGELLMKNLDPGRLSHWQPSASIKAIKARAEVYASARAFFCERDVLEVETPLLSQSTASDPYLESVPVSLKVFQDQSDLSYYLHTSPEFPMKRLLAFGSGPIYQICKTFRNAETGRRHNPEFTMLEWYRPGFGLHDLMNEISDLVSLVLNDWQCSFEKLSYRDAFLRYLGIDPFLASDEQLKKLAQEKAGFSVSSNNELIDRDDYLNVLLSVCIEPELGQQSGKEMSPVFLHGYPSSQASLAKVKKDEFGQLVAERFELYINGLELANGYFELTDAKEQENRFKQDNQQRLALNLPEVPIDKNLLDALEAGMPLCSGVALGLDRLLMVKLQATSIEEVISFPITRA